MVEVQDEACYVPHHKQKLVFILSAISNSTTRINADRSVVN